VYGYESRKGYTCGGILMSMTWEDHKFEATLGYMAIPCLPHFPPPLPPLLPFISWTWVTRAKKDEGDYRVVLNSHFIEDHYCFL
jgi:hypothetical protein